MARQYVKNNLDIVTGAMEAFNLSWTAAECKKLVVIFSNFGDNSRSCGEEQEEVTDRTRDSIEFERQQA